MSNGLASRALKFLIGEDEAVNGLLGGGQRETISGTVGRALAKGAAWATPAAWVLDHIFGAGHCAGEAAKEAARRTADAEQ